MNFSQFLTLILTGTLGTFAYTLVFRMRKRLILWTVLCGFLTMALYTFCVQKTELVFWQNLFPAVFATAFAEILARVTKAPTTPYIVCSIIPLVPGGTLFYTMSHFIHGETAPFHDMLLQTLRISSGLAVGILCVSAVTHIILKLKKEIRKI